MKLQGDYSGWLLREKLKSNCTLTGQNCTLIVDNCTLIGLFFVRLVLLISFISCISSNIHDVLVTC